ncbi:MAG: hypothetical protein CMC89_02985, partial [Flavobacteriaceae bacterium]|nr:hypothetical protein [Flavobacteriaceae bacterium]
MAQTIKLKNSGTSSNTPSSLVHGEIAINYADGKIFYKNSSGNIVEFSTSTGSFLPLSGGTLTGNLSLGDNVKAQFGAGNDLEIFSSGSTALLKAGNATSDIRIESDNRIVIADRGFNEAFAVFNDDSDVKLYHNGLQKLATTSTGIDVTGSVTADGLTVEGSSVGGTYITSASGSASGDIKIQHIINSSRSINTLNSETGSGSAIRLDLA